MSHIYRGIDGKYHFVYRTTNLINGNFYIGKHSTDDLHDKYMGRGVHLEKAIKKYGKKNFERIIVKCFDTEQKAYAYEKKIVTEEIVRSRNSYNAASGGQGAMFGENNGFYGKFHKSETKQKMREKKIGGKLSPEHKKKISESSKKVPKKQCPHCKGWFNPGVYNRLHGDKCLKPIPKIKCKYCYRSFDHGNYAKHHGEKCKHKSLS